MKISEKVSYLKGLLEGLKLDENESNTKILNVIVDILEDIASASDDMEQRVDELELYLDEVDEDLEAVEDYLEGECDDDCECCSDDDYYTIVCPSCGEEFCVDDEVAAAGEINCPSCGEELEFDLSECKDCADDKACDCE